MGIPEQNTYLVDVQETSSITYRIKAGSKEEAEGIAADIVAGECFGDIARRMAPVFRVQAARKVKE